MFFFFSKTEIFDIDFSSYHASESEPELFENMNANSYSIIRFKTLKVARGSLEKFVDDF